MLRHNQFVLSYISIFSTISHFFAYFLLQHLLDTIRFRFIQTVIWNVRLPEDSISIKHEMEEKKKENILLRVKKEIFVGKMMVRPTTAAKMMAIAIQFS